MLNPELMDSAVYLASFPRDHVFSAKECDYRQVTMPTQIHIAFRGPNSRLHAFSQVLYLLSQSPYSCYCYFFLLVPEI